MHWQSQRALKYCIGGPQRLPIGAAPEATSAQVGASGGQPVQGVDWQVRLQQTTPQHSTSAAQAAPSGWHWATAHFPPVHTAFPQQSAAPAQAAPVGAQHAPPTQAAPAQQVAWVAHAAPSESHDPALLVLLLLLEEEVVVVPPVPPVPPVPTVEVVAPPPVPPAPGPPSYGG